MWDVSSFLLRWMFVSNMCRDVAQIQLLPMCQSNHGYNYNHNDPMLYPPPSEEGINPHATDTTAASSTGTQSPLSTSIEWRNPLLVVTYEQSPSTPLTPTTTMPTLTTTSAARLGHDRHAFDHQSASAWKDDCLRSVLSYPPGLQRVMAMDAMRTNLVQQLVSWVRNHQETLERNKIHLLSMDSAKTTESPRSTFREASIPTNDKSHTKEAASAPSLQTTDDTTTTTTITAPSAAASSLDDLVQTLSLGELPVGDADDTDTKPNPQPARRAQHAASTPTDSPLPPTLNQVREAKLSLLHLRNYLPQLVAAVLKSPPAFFAHSSNPILQLRTLILSTCLRDPSMGVELCWLLEAEVGRAWKALLEHRQETGRRLIVVLPADKAVVLAKIGMEKSEAFDFLQEAEQATAYGYTTLTGYDQAMNSVLTKMNSPRLPSSLSYRRCSHFGDTMQFIDRLTKISSDLRMVPTLQRYDVLHESLHELNRRIRRRMITRGDVTIDMEDHRSSNDWPRIEDMSMDMIQYSVHLPLIPQVDAWPDGDKQTSDGPDTTTGDRMPNTEVLRVLNLVVSETKILSSRERCPFLVHLEVADSGLEGNDARLYSSGVTGLGSTIGEALGVQSTDNIFATTPARHAFDVPTPTYGIPSELLPEPLTQQHPFFILSGSGSDQSTPEMYSTGVMEQRTFPRGGYQAEGQGYDLYDVVSSEYATSTFDPARQHQYELLHQQLHLQGNNAATPPPSIPMIHPTISTGNDLLDIVFGREWVDKCKEIRDVSPYGHVKGWRLASFILKAGEDIRREAFVMQIISKLQKWFKDEIPERHRPFMRPYTIMCVGGDAGLLECLSDAKSVDEVKKRTDGYTSLRHYFERAYGPPRSTSRMAPHGTNYGMSGPQHPVAFGLPRPTNRGAIPFETAQDNFLRSLVGYSLVCYILQIKDRHNANILLDRVGHIMHIDFGFVLGDTPKMGKVPIFSERAPFKLSGDFWDVLGGWNVQGGGLGVKFCEMFELAFATASAHAEEIASLTEAAMLSLDSNPRAARAIANGVRSRLRMRGDPGSRIQKMFVMELVNAALTCWGTSTYDWLQRNMNGYQ